MAKKVLYRWIDEFDGTKKDGYHYRIVDYGPEDGGRLLRVQIKLGGRWTLGYVESGATARSRSARSR